MIGSNLYVGDFGDYQHEELFKFLGNFNLLPQFYPIYNITYIKYQICTIVVHYHL